MRIIYPVVDAVSMLQIILVGLLTSRSCILSQTSVNMTQNVKSPCTCVTAEP
jgi:hypothetical protein